MSLYSDSLLDEIRMAAPMIEIATEFWGAPNPAHTHKFGARWGGHGSRHVNTQECYWKNFETDEGGDIFELVMMESGRDFPAAVAYVAERAGIRLPEKSSAVARDGREASPTPDAQPEDESPPETAPQGRWVMVKGYPYVSPDGDKIYQVVRLQEQLPDGSFVLDPKTGNPKKKFRQRRPDGRGGFIWNLDGIEHTIYRHDEVEKAIERGEVIWLVEGEKDADTLVEWGLCGTTNSGGAQHWTATMAGYLRGADVVILPDNDDAGRSGAEKKALSLRGIAARVRVLDLARHVPALPAKGDVTDWRDKLGGTVEILLDMVGSLADWTPAPPKSVFGAMTIDEAVRVGRRAHSWLVQDLIELRGTCSFAGFTQTGKSFAMIKLGFSIALGQQFFGHDVAQGLVIYQVGEGATGFLKRVEGYCQDAGIEDRSGIPLVILPAKINLFVDDKDTDALINECKDWGAYWQARSGQKLRALVIDTFNKATRGANEISGQDMGKINDRVERIARELDCTVIVVDHLSAQGRLRGHTSKTDDMANTVKVELTGKEDNNGRKIRQMVFEKVKDGENGVSVPFVLRSINIGLDDMGHPVTTCVVDSPDGEISEELSKGAVSVGPALLLRIIKDTAEIMGTAAPPELVQVPPGRKVARWEDVKEMVRKQWSLKSTDPKEVETEVRRICGQYGNKLKLAGYIDRDNDRGLIWWTGKEDRMRKPAEAKPAEPPPPLPADVRESIKAGEAPF